MIRLRNLNMPLMKIDPNTTHKRHNIFCSSQRLVMETECSQMVGESQFPQNQVDASTSPIEADPDFN